MTSTYNKRHNKTPNMWRRSVTKDCLYVSINVEKQEKFDEVIKDHRSKKDMTMR
jgi:hypothetical protein